MVKLFGKSLLEWQIDVFRELGIKDISVVTGYKKELIAKLDVKLIDFRELDLLYLIMMLS